MDNQQQHGEPVNIYLAQSFSFSPSPIPSSIPTSFNATPFESEQQNQTKPKNKKRTLRLRYDRLPNNQVGEGDDFEQ